MELPGALLSPSSKNKKVHPEKIPYISGNGNFLYFLKKSFSYISGSGNPPKKFLILSGNGNPKKRLMFQEVIFHAQKIKGTHSEKMSYISGDVTFKPQA